MTLQTAQETTDQSRADNAAIAYLDAKKAGSEGECL